MKSKRRGFTLLELLVVMSLISLLSSLVMTSVNSARAKSRDIARIAQINQIQKALEMYYVDYGTYVVSVGAVTAGYHNGGNGWVAFQGTDYPLGVTNALAQLGYLSTSAAEDQNITSVKATYSVAPYIYSWDQNFMIYVCNGGQSYSLTAVLEASTTQNMNHVISLCNGTGSNATGGRYLKNYGVGH